MADRVNIKPEVVGELTTNYVKQRGRAVRDFATKPDKGMERVEQSAYKAYVDTSRARALRNASNRDGSWFTPAINSVKSWGKDVLQGIGHVRLSDIAAQNKANAGAIARGTKATGRFIKDSATEAGKAVKETAQGLAATSGKEWGDYLHDSLLQFDQAATGALADTTELGAMLRIPGAEWLNNKANALHKHMINDYEYRNINNKSDALRFITQNALGFAGVGGVGKGVARLGLKAATKAAKVGLKSGGSLSRGVQTAHRVGKATARVTDKLKKPLTVAGTTGAVAPIADKLFGFTGSGTTGAVAARNAVPYLALANIRSPKALARTLKLSQTPNLRGYGFASLSGASIPALSMPSGNVPKNGLTGYFINQVGKDLADPGNHFTQRMLGIIPTMSGISRKLVRPSKRSANGNLLYTALSDNDHDVDKYLRYLGYATNAFNIYNKARTAQRIGRQLTKN